MPPKETRHRVTINDFRPGIISNTRAGAQNVEPGTLDSMPGIAAEGTIACIANATGQLVPLPAGEVFDTLTPGSGSVTPDLNTVPVGIAAVGPVSNFNFDPFVSHGDVVVAWINYTGTQSATAKEFFQAFVKRPSEPFESLQIFVGLTNPLSLTKRGVSWAHTRGRRSTFTLPGFPIIVWEYTSGAPFFDGAEMDYVVYPDPNSLASNTPFNEAGTIDNSTLLFGGQILAHSGRILRLCENSSQFGSSTTGLTNPQYYYTNETVRFTDPPGNISLAATTTDSILDEQYPGGYGAWGSISTGELLLIKRYGGAILVEGDVYAPQITRLAGVVSTGNLINQATPSPNGLIYCVENDGAYIWAGGATSQKINKINDNFHMPQTAMNCGRGADHCNWNNWIVFTNGWLYDSVNDSWWQLATNIFSDGNLIQWVAAASGSPQFLYCLPGALNASNVVEVGRFDRTTQTTSYTWISQPIPVSTYQTIDIRAIEISFSNVDTNTEAFIEFTGLDGVTPFDTTMSLPTAGRGPFRLRAPVGWRGNSVFFSVTVTADTFAPIINEITVEYVEAGPMGQGQ